MRNSMRHLLAAALVAAPFGTAFAAPRDAPVAPSGTLGKAPSAEAAATIRPSRGTGASSAEAVRATGAVLVGEEAVAASSLGTVAHGAFGVQPESVINWDSRTRGYTTTYPNRAIVFIEYDGAHLCTGWLYSSNTIATAGHCVHTGGSSGAWRTASKYKIYPGRDGTSSPYGYCTVKWLRSVTGWTVNNDFKYDYGAMRLNCTIGNTVGYFGMYTPSAPTGQPAIVAGYPGDKPRTLWTAADKIRDYSNEMIGYRMDTIGGHSGSPIWHDRDEGLSSSGAWGFGVHNYGVGAFGSNMNAAARLTSARITNYVNWKNTP